MHGDRAVSLAREAVAEAKEAARRLTDQAGEALDRLDREAGDRRRPLRRAGGEMGLQLVGYVGVFRQIVAVGVAVAEEHVHDGAGERRIGAGAQDQRDIGLFHRRGAIDVDDGDLGAALLAGSHGVGHHVDLRRHRIGAPDHHEIGFRHLARICTGQPSRAGDPAGPRERRADGTEFLGIFLGVAQPVDAVALHLPHGAGVVIGPHRRRAVFGLDAQEFGRDAIEGLFPRRLAEFTRALGAGADQRGEEAVGRMHPFGVARHLRADHAGRVGVQLRAAHPSYGVGVEDIDLERADGRTVVRAGRQGGADGGGAVHVSLFRMGLLVGDHRRGGRGGRAGRAMKFPDRIDASRR